MRLIDADAICFDELKNDFDRARAKIIIMSQPTVDTRQTLCEKCLHIGVCNKRIAPHMKCDKFKALLPPPPKPKPPKAKTDAYKEVWRELRSMCGAPHWCVWLSDIDMFFEKLMGVESFEDVAGGDKQ